MTADNELIKSDRRKAVADEGPFANVAAKKPRDAHDSRPDFMMLLGLLPPYTLEDVEKAHKARAREAHPDHGGSQHDFLRVQEAYASARDYVQFHDGRRQWLAAQVEPYLRQQEIVATILEHGGAAQIEQVDWMARSDGDFAVLAERLRTVALRGHQRADELAAYLGQHAKDLRYLQELDLSQSSITDAGLRGLEPLRSLRRLNLAETNISVAGLDLLSALPEIERVNIARTKIGAFTRWRLGSRFPHVRFLSRATD
jgi:hypothetical protein